jgi:hypothetical protein
MMFTWQFLLLFLLAVDWVEDAHYGQSPFSRPLASQVYRADELRPQHLSDDATLIPACNPLPFEHLHDCLALSRTPLLMNPSEPNSRPPLYTFMSIQC